MSDSNIDEYLEEPQQETAEQQPEALGERPEDMPAEAVDQGPKAAAMEARSLATAWLDNALMMLRASVRAFDAEPAGDMLSTLGIETVRRHFHTDRRNPGLSEAAAIKLIDQNFQSMRTFLSLGESIFLSADDETASRNTRGYFGSGLIVAAYAYPQKAISFTSHYPTLGPKCKAAVIIHQLAHFIDARMRDQSCGGLLYDAANFESSLMNVHCYPNFAVNASPPYIDERYGMARPEL